MQTKKNLLRSIALIAASLSLLSACGIGYRNTTPIPPPPPLAKLSLSTTALIFGPTIVNTSSPPQQLAITNQDTTPITFTSIEPRRDAAAFKVDSTTCSQLTPGKSCTVNIIFSPKSTGSLRSWLFLSIAGHSGEGIKLSGESIPPPPSH